MDEVIPPLIPRCDKGTQTFSPSFHVQRLDLGKRRMEPPLALKYSNRNPRRVQTTLFFDFLLLSTIKAALRSQSYHFTQRPRDMEDELAFTLNLAMYQEADLGDYITFMTNFRGILNRLKPSEVFY
ncbi:hypothetical protein TNCV_1234271 [Trichonephila clavipes]|nr:hypothetical protein TNCV_1234271 [Trichonephila clavipes]